MADNYDATQGEGTHFKAKEIGGVLYPGLILYDEAGNDVAGWAITTGNIAISSLPGVVITTGNVYDESADKHLLRILEQVSVPVWYIPDSNALNVTGSVSVSSGTVTTVSTVTTVATVTNQTNLGGIPADPMVPALLNDVWANAIRANLT
jgi:hypothetical protein